MVNARISTPRNMAATLNCCIMCLVMALPPGHVLRHEGLKACSVAPCWHPNERDVRLRCVARVVAAMRICGPIIEDDAGITVCVSSHIHLIADLPTALVYSCC